MPVTNENREEFVRLYLEWMLGEAVADQFKAFKRGFDKVVTGKVAKVRTHARFTSNSG